MRRVIKTGLILATLLLAAAPLAAQARMHLGSSKIMSPTDYPGAPRRIQGADGSSSPYAMNYADEAVQTLGFRNGHMDVFAARPADNQSYLPVFSGGVGADGAMFKLQWHPGE